MEKQIAQWKKRSEVFRAIYSELIKEESSEIFIKTCFENFNFDHDQMQLVETYIKYKSDFIKLITKNLSQNWSYNRLPVVDKAILLTALAEAKLAKFNKKIIISQAIITTKHYSLPANKDFINAILDKIITDNYETPSKA